MGYADATPHLWVAWFAALLLPSLSLSLSLSPRLLSRSFAFTLSLSALAVLSRASVILLN